MLIAIDYDKTYTEDPGLWDRFISDAKESGCDVICVTLRYESEGKEVQNALGDKVGKIVFTGRKAKGPYLAGFGVKPNIWIDDNPTWIVWDADS